MDDLRARVAGQCAGTPGPLRGLPEGVMRTGEWLLLIVSFLTAIFLAVALWKPEKF
jgi:hypothetical protein